MVVRVLRFLGHSSHPGWVFGGGTDQRFCSARSSWTAASCCGVAFGCPIPGVVVKPKWASVAADYRLADPEHHAKVARGGG